MRRSESHAQEAGRDDAPWSRPRTRRSVLTGGLSGAALLALGCSRLPWRRDARLDEAIRELPIDPEDAVPIADAVGWTRERAQEVLDGATPHADPDEDPRVAIDRLTRDDFRAGRVERVDRWTLAHTEIALAVLMVPMQR